jgi:glycosyltransferase involved in cell wall biosynthesis
LNLGILLPGFSADEHDVAIPVQLHLLRALTQTDEVRVLALRYPHRRDRYTVAGADVISLGAAQGRGLRRLSLWLDALRTLRRLHREKPFDLLHAMWADETGLIAAWAGRQLGVPVVVSAIGGELVRLDDIGYGLQHGAFSRWIVRQAIHGADAVVLACEYQRRLLDRANNIDHAKVRIIPYGVDTALFSPEAMPPDQPSHLVAVGSLIGVKDHATLLRALARLDAQVTLEIVGEGPERLRLEAQAYELGVRDRVTFTGSIPHHALPGIYRRAALHVLTSRHEGQGMVTIEAAACGVPTVSTAVGIVPDFPTLGVSVPVGDDVALAEAIWSILDDPARRAAMSAAALQSARDSVRIDETAERLRALYPELTNRRAF